MTKHLERATDALDRCFAAKPYSLQGSERTLLLDQGLASLNRHHYESCPAYRRILDGYWRGGLDAETLDQHPYLPASIFKTQELRSVPDSEVRLTLTSSGTTGQTPSRIFVDRETSALQQRALITSLMHAIGPKRLPMLIVDSASTVSDRNTISARGAGILGMMRFGHNHCYALDDSMLPKLDEIRQFLKEFGGKPFLIFGFTFMIWSGIYEKLHQTELDMSNGILIHSGGWKKMLARSVDNRQFRQIMNVAFGLHRIYNFYGMVEQLGSIFLEGPDGLLYPPNFSDVIIRDPETWAVAEPGIPGLVQVLSLLPRSYPGHNLLTEDIGVIEATYDSSDGWGGKGIRILGRVNEAELRGCSDTFSAPAIL